MKTARGLASLLLVVSCHLDKLVSGGSGPVPPSHNPPAALVFATEPGVPRAGHWGDGSSTSSTSSSEGSISASHSYLTLLPASFTVRVTVTDSHGATGSDQKVVTVVLL